MKKTVFIGIDPGKETTGIVVYDKVNRTIAYYFGGVTKSMQTLSELHTQHGEAMEVVIELPANVFYARHAKGNSMDIQIKISRDTGVNRGVSHCLLSFCQFLGASVVQKDCGKSDKKLKKQVVQNRLKMLDLKMPTVQHLYDAAYMIIDKL